MEVTESTVDELRAGHESGAEWRLRRAFLLAHAQRFPLERLVCLSNCYVNVHIYGCRYPEGVQVLLSQLSADLPKESASSIGYHERKQVKFVKAKESVEPSETVTSIFDTPQQTPKKPGLMFVKAADNYESTKVGSSSMDPALAGKGSISAKKSFKESLQDFQRSAQQEQSSEQLQKFYVLSGAVRDLAEKRKNAIEMIHMAVDKARMLCSPIISSSTNGFTCELKIDFVTLSTSESGTKKTAKHTAYENARDLLRKPYLKIHESDPENKTLLSSDQPFDEASGSSMDLTSPRNKTAFSNAGIMKLGRSTSSNIHALAKARKRPSTNSFGFDASNFLIIEPMVKADSMNALSILRQSADFNKVQYEQEYEQTGSHIKCHLLLGGEVVVSVAGDSRLTLKTLTAERALDKLQSQCWTIKTKKHEDTDESGIDREGFLGELKSDIDTGKIGDSNIGNQLLRKMGWSGGGLGKVGNKGIAEPITAGNVINREGLGLKAEQGISAKFMPKVRETIQNYIRSDKQEDLVFSPLFKKEERALIHKESQKFGLKSHSYGTGDDRYLVLSRKRSPNELFQHIMKSGGETSKYILVPPGENT